MVHLTSMPKQMGANCDARAATDESVTTGIRATRGACLSSSGVVSRPDCLSQTFIELSARDTIDSDDLAPLQEQMGALETALLDLEMYEVTRIRQLCTSIEGHLNNAHPFRASAICFS